MKDFKIELNIRILTLCQKESLISFFCSTRFNNIKILQLSYVTNKQIKWVIEKLKFGYQIFGSQISYLNSTFDTVTN